MLKDVLLTYGAEEVSPMDVYTDVFKLGDNLIQRENEEPGNYKSNPLAYWKNNDADTGHFRIMFEDCFEDVLRELQAADFAILNGLTYFGRSRTQNHASKMFALIFDLDGITDDTLNNLMSGVCANVYPAPNYIVTSGTGIHLYYVFEDPIPLFPNIKLQLKELKYALTDKLWNRYTSKDKKVQHQGINQGFRVLGGKTKDGALLDTVVPYRYNQHPFSLKALCEYVPEEYRVDESKLFKETKMSLADAKKKYPKWYEKVIVNKDRTPTKWDIAGKVHGDNPYALYDWWLNNIKEGATFGHRYFCIMCLVIYAVKNDVSFDKVRDDAYALIPLLNDINPSEPFTREDVDSALECYDDRYCTFPRKDIAKISSIEIKANKRNYRDQETHLERARAVQKVDYPNGEWRKNSGRKSKCELVYRWREDNPHKNKADCSREIGLDPKTVRKWWEWKPPQIIEYKVADRYKAEVSKYDFDWSVDFSK